MEQNANMSECLWPLQRKRHDTNLMTLKNAHSLPKRRYLYVWVVHKMELLGGSTERARLGFFVKTVCGKQQEEGSKGYIQKSNTYML